ncbi:MAG: ABC transporter substrate-binding protein [Micrococcaceae bacterium]
MTTTTLPRRRSATLAAALLSVALVLTGCGSEGASNGSDDVSTDPGSSAGYPVTVDTAWGELTIEEKPERIVVFGPMYVDVLTSLDEPVTAFTSGNLATEDQLLQNYPWLEGLTGPFDPEVATAAADVSLEAVAAYEPDLILGTIWTTPEDRYEQFSQIAPTYVGRDSDVATGWEDVLTDVGALTGKPEEATQLIAEVEAAFADAAERLPGLQGKTYSAVTFNLDKNEFVFTSTAPWLQDLGLVPAENQPTSNISQGQTPNLSLENIEQLNGDVLIIGESYLSAPGETQQFLEADPRFSELPASQNGAVLFQPSAVGLANTNGGPIALRWMLDQVVPQLEEMPLNKDGQ